MRVVWFVIGLLTGMYLFGCGSHVFGATADEDYAKITIVDQCLQSAQLAYAIELERSRFGKTFDEFVQDVATAKEEYRDLLLLIGQFVYGRTWTTPEEAGRTWFRACLANFSGGKFPDAE